MVPVDATAFVRHIKDHCQAAIATGPVYVERYKLPHVWLVSHSDWMDRPHYRHYMCPEHPLFTVDEHLTRNPEKQEILDLLGQLTAPEHLHISPRAILRLMLVRILYGHLCSDEALSRAVRECMPIRWFVGLKLTDCVWDVRTISTALRAGSTNARVVSFVKVVTLDAQRFDFPNAPDFRLNDQLLDAWTARATEG